MEKTVLIIFKTHLDIGFTNYAETVIDNYISTFIPNAIRVGNELYGTDTPFIWTVGSWMIDRALKLDKTGTVEKAVRDGILNWHALPFTTHTELMSRELFAYGLDISARLDARFGKHTIGSKMTDVPGHTKGMIPELVRHGVKFLHIGINPATPVPPVPRLFRWKCGSDQVVVMYEGDYGKIAEFEDFAVCFAHTGDNRGPQSKEEIIKVYDELRVKFPGYKLKAATLDDLAEYACKVPELPILENEIGDTWIHGAATDPEKLSRYRRVLRHIGKNGITADLTDNLLLVPEHTWGMDVKTHFKDDTNYTHEQMEAVGEKRAEIEASWREQREYVERAERLLGLTSEYPISEPSFEYEDEYEKIDLDREFDLGFGVPEFTVSWQIFDNRDYDRYMREYMRLNEKNYGWATWDFTKIGLPDFEGGVWEAIPTAAWKRDNARFYRLEFDRNVTEKYGLPYFIVGVENGRYCFKWFGKRINRMPQACHVKFNRVGEDWRIEKMGQLICPESIIGSPQIAAIDMRIENREYEIYSLDAALVEPFGKRLLHYADTPEAQDMHFCLYNNIWNTNFPMWYGDDAMFRFVVKKK